MRLSKMHKVSGITLLLACSIAALAVAAVGTETASGRGAIQALLGTAKTTVASVTGHDVAGHPAQQAATETSTKPVLIASNSRRNDVRSDDSADASAQSDLAGSVDAAARPEVFQFAPIQEDSGASQTDAKEADTEGLARPGKEEIAKRDATGEANLVPENAQCLVPEIEPNATCATATPLGGTNVVGIGNIYLGGDVDVWSFAANAGDRVYAATMTSFSASSADTTLTLLAGDCTTILESDLDDGTIGGTASSIAGTLIPSTGTYYLRVVGGVATAQVRPYHLHLRVQSGAPTAEVEGNNTPATANPLPANGWVSGTHDPATDADFFSFAANAGDTVFLSLDADPERDTVTWNPRLGIFPFADAGNLILVVDDTNTVSPNSEALFMTVKNTGTYYAYVDTTAQTTGGPTQTYHLSVSIHPACPPTPNCTTYTSTDVPKTIGPAAGLVSSTITVPGSPRVADLDVSITLSHLLMADIDAHLRSPAGNDNGLFTDIGSTATGTAAQTMMDLVFDDEAGMPPLFTVVKGPEFQPELAYRLHWFDGENAGGTWTLDLRDDTTNASGGTLSAWSLTICEPPPAPTCTGVPVTVYTNDFEAGDGGFTHSGAQDEWARGLPTSAPVTGCNSGTNCWKTDLTGTYNASANEDLVSSNISLVGLGAPIQLSWAQKYQMESASFDTFSLQVREPGPTNVTTLYQFLDATMTDSVGSPAVTINESAGWGVQTRSIDAYANKVIQLRYNLTSDTTGQFAGLGIDDVTITACCTAASCDDGNPCTDDICSTSGCSHTPTTAPCSDGNPCTSNDACSGGVCVGTPNTDPCNDGNACTSNDTCSGGACVGTNNSDPCNDGNACTSNDTCTGGVCVGTNNTNPCTDGNPCTLGDACSGGVCVPGPSPASIQFCSSAPNSPITILDSAAASPYPSAIAVSGLGPYLCKATVNLNGLTHTFPDDIDMLLVAPGTVQNAEIMSDVGSGTDIVGINLTLDDAAATSLPDAGPLVSGTFKPTDVNDGADTFPAPSPAPTGGVALSTFTGTNPNGTWKLFVRDDLGGDTGSLNQWCINLAVICAVDADCADTNPCTDDTCVAGACVHTNNTAPCNDGNPCTSPDACSGGTCVGTPNTDPCNDGNACTSNDTCTGGVCVGTNNTDPCNDNNPCTSNDTCSGGACVGTNNTDPCSDGNPCTIGDVCSGGVCVPGPGPTNLSSYCSTGAITILDAAIASPYPSNISVGANGGSVVCRTTVDINGLTHTFPDDIDMLLVAPGTATNAKIMSDAGGSGDVLALSFTLDDAAATSLPDAGPLVSGTFKPTDINDGADSYPAPAPAASGGSALSAFNGSNPTGTWKLFIVDDAAQDTGSLGQWCLNLSRVCLAAAECDDGNVCTDDLCTNSECAHANNTAACDDGCPFTSNDTCGGGVCVPGTPILTPAQIQGVMIAADKTTISWSADINATRYDVLRGDVAALPVGPGGGDEFCFNDVGGTSIVDGTVPASGSSNWYLVRGENCGSNGSYGTQSNATPRLSATCP